MKYSGIIKNDFCAAPGVSVTVFVQGCPHHCKNCHNPETWDYNGGKEFNYETLIEIEKAMQVNGIKRNLCIMGGEPLCPENQFLTLLIIKSVKEKYPNTKVYVWTGYIYEQLIKNHSKHLEQILKLSDFLIDGPYIEELRDITLKMRGSSNQRIIDLTLEK